MKTETAILVSLTESLGNKIYNSLINQKQYSIEEGEFIELGMGEMAECKEEAERIVSEWLKENNLVEVESEPILTN